jgi:hypothetical protein
MKPSRAANAQRSPAMCIAVVIEVTSFPETDGNSTHD